MNWIDEGIVLAIKHCGDSVRLITIFTRHYGKINAMLYKKEKISIFDNVCIEYRVKISGGLGYIIVKSCKSNWVLIMHSERKLLVCQAICFALNTYFCQHIEYTSLFDIVKKIFERLPNVDEMQALCMYTFFDFKLLYTLGYGFDHVCRCGNKTCVIGYSGDAFCASCDRLSEKFIIPEIWQKWINGDFDFCSIDNMLSSMKIVDYFLGKYINSAGINVFKSMIIKSLIKY